MTVLSSRALPQLASVGTPVPADAFGYLRLPRAARDPRCLWTCKAQNPTNGGGRKNFLLLSIDLVAIAQCDTANTVDVLQNPRLLRA